MTQTGSLYMEAAKRGQKTVVVDCAFTGAFKVARPVYLQDDHPTVYCIHVGGGYVDGDCYETEVVVQESAQLTVTTQASTKVYKTPRQPVKQVTSLSLKKGSILEFLPDPLIAYEHSRFIQDTVVYMEKGATLLYSDIITPGWSQTGEPFQYEWVRSKLKVYEADSLQVYDHLLLQPNHGDITGIMQMEGYTHFGSWVLISPFATSQLLQQFDEMMDSIDTDVRVGRSTLKMNGIVVRILAKQTQQIERLFQACTDLARQQWQQEPLCLRKY